MNCPLCQQPPTRILTEKLRKGNGKVYYCGTCDLGYLDNQITPEQTKAFYDGEYRQQHSHTAEGSSTHAQEMYALYKDFQQSRLQIILPYLGIGADLLEIGASAGQFLSHVQSRCNTVHGIELDSACCHFLSDKFGIETDDRFLTESRFAQGQYDVVCSFQVMEHTPNPVQFLKEIEQVTKPGGMIFIEVPNLYDPLLAVWDAPFYQQFYYHQAHSFYFSEWSLYKIVAQTGLRVVATHFTQDYNLLNHLHWITTNTPQPTCMIGLNPPRLHGKDDKIANWLSEELVSLNARYVEKLSAAKKTSNIMLVLHKP